MKLTLINSTVSLWLMASVGLVKATTLDTACCDEVPEHVKAFVANDDCTGGYVCLNGPIQFIECPAGLIFDESSKGCGWPSLVGECHSSCPGAAGSSSGDEDSNSGDEDSNSSDDAPASCPSGTDNLGPKLSVSDFKGEFSTLRTPKDIMKPLGRESQVSLLVGGNYNGPLAAEIEGGIVVLGNFNIGAKGVSSLGWSGAGSGVQPKRGVFMQVGGDIIGGKTDGTTQAMVGGSIEYGGTCRSKVSTDTKCGSWSTNGNGKFINADLDAEPWLDLFDELQEKSDTWYSLPNNGVVKIDNVGRQFMNVTLKAGDDDCLQVFFLPEPALVKPSEFILDSSLIGKTILINVELNRWGNANIQKITNFRDTQGKSGMDFGSDEKAAILWNFGEAGTVTLKTPCQWPGSVLVPHGNLNVFSPGQDGRTVVFGNLVHKAAGSELHNYELDPPCALCDNKSDPPPQVFPEIELTKLAGPPGFCTQADVGKLDDDIYTGVSVTNEWAYCYVITVPQSSNECVKNVELFDMSRKGYAAPYGRLNLDDTESGNSICPGETIYVLGPVKGFGDAPDPSKNGRVTGRGVESNIFVRDVDDAGVEVYVPPPLASGCERAWAYFEGFSTCFTDLPDEYNLGDDWGWSLGPITQGWKNLDIYTKAYGCDIESGTKIGTVRIHWEYSWEKVRLDIRNALSELNAGADTLYAFKEVRLYAGKDPVVIKADGSYSNDPVDFPYNGEDAPFMPVPFYYLNDVVARNRKRIFSSLYFEVCEVPQIEITKLAGPPGLCTQADIGNLDDDVYTGVSSTSEWVYCYVISVPESSNECVKDIELRDASAKGLTQLDVSLANTASGNSLCQGETLYIEGPINDFQDAPDPSVDATVIGAGVTSGVSTEASDDAGVEVYVPPPLASGCERAWAYFDGFSTCFTDLPDEYNLGDDWGWSLGPITQGWKNLDIYTKAYGCDIESGTKIGTVRIHWEYSWEKVRLDIRNALSELNAGADTLYAFKEVRLYAGKDPVVIKADGSYSNDPVDFPYNGEDAPFMPVPFYYLNDVVARNRKRIFSSLYFEVCEVPQIEITKLAGPPGLCTQADIGNLDDDVYTGVSSTSEWVYCYVISVPESSNECVKDIELRDASAKGLTQLDVSLANTASGNSLCQGETLYIEGPINDFQDAPDPSVDATVIGAGVTSGVSTEASDDAGVEVYVPPPLASGCERAWAYFDGFSTCFTDLPDEYNLGDDWGWSLGPITQGWKNLDIYTKAYGCDIESGTKIGTVRIHWEYSWEKVRLDIRNALSELNAGADTLYAFKEVRLYAGKDPVVIKADGSYSNDPVDFPYNGEDAPFMPVPFYYLNDVVARNRKRIFSSLYFEVCEVPQIEITKLAGPPGLCTQADIGNLDDDVYTGVSSTSEWVYCYVISVPESSNECVKDIELRDASAKGLTQLDVSLANTASGNSLCQGETLYIEGPINDFQDAPDPSVDATVIGAGVTSGVSTEASDDAGVEVYVPPPLASGCERAWAYFEGFSTCFTDLPDEYNLGDDWGWSLGPITQGWKNLDIYTKAYGCDIESGTKIGTVRIHWEYSWEKVRLDIRNALSELNAGADTLYAFKEVRLYAGKDPVVIKADGSYSNDPVDFPYNGEDAPFMPVPFYYLNDVVARTNKRIFSSLYFEVCEVPQIEITKLAGPPGLCTQADIGNLDDDLYTAISVTNEWVYCYVISVPESSNECVKDIELRDASAKGLTQLDVSLANTASGNSLCQGETLYIEGPINGFQDAPDRSVDATVIGVGVQSGVSTEASDDAGVEVYVPPPLASGCERAWAYYEGFSTCFTDLPDEYNLGDDWGWSLGPFTNGWHTLDIYAKAYGCDIESGIKIGTMRFFFEYYWEKVKLDFTLALSEAGNGVTYDELRWYTGKDHVVFKADGSYSNDPVDFPYDDLQIHELPYEENSQKWMTEVMPVDFYYLNDVVKRTNKRIFSSFYFEVCGLK